MIDGLKLYPAYKDSGVPWLGQVPAHWEVRRIKRIARLNPSKSEVSSALRDGQAVFLPMERVGTDGRFDASEVRPISDLWSGFTYFRRGDVIVAKITPCFENGKGACLENLPTAIGFGSTEFHAIRPSQAIVSAYLYRVTSLSEFRRLGTDEMIGAAGQQRVPVEFIANFPIPIPPLPEQTAIVRFLDYMDRRIRRAIRARQKRIKLLEEYKQALIHEAVTGKIDVRIGKPYPMYKDSGVPWLGKVPEHWEVRRLGSLLQERREVNEGLRVTEVLSVLREKGVIPYAEKGNIGNKKSDDISRYNVVRPNDIVVNSMNVIIGSVGLSKFTGCISPVYYILKRREAQDDPRYLNACFQTKPFQQSLIRLGNGILAHRMRIPMELLKCEPFPRPPADEQTAIVAYLDAQTAKIDAAIAATRHEIDLLREFRERLIADVVTGKVDVREVAAQLPEEPPENEEVEVFEEEAAIAEAEDEVLSEESDAEA